MKKILLVCCLGVLMISCETEDPSIIKVVLGEEFILKESQTAVINLPPRVTSETTEHSLSFDFRLDSVSDSRCPSDVNCVWEGFATTGVSITSEETQHKTLCLGNCSINETSDSVRFVLESGEYLAVLKAILPYPTSKNGDHGKSGVFIITK